MTTNKMELQGIEEADQLLQNGILVETDKGLVCISLTEALSSDFNLSVDDLQTVAKQLILSENAIESSDTAVDSDDPTSDASDLLLRQKLTIIDDRLPGTSSADDAGGSSLSDANTIENDTAKHVGETLMSKPLNPTTKSVVKPVKRRGGWPKGRKRKPELLHLPPKAPATGYNLYLNEMRKQFKDSSLPFYEITKIIGNRWSSLSLEEKKPYLERAEEDKRRYRGELRAYRQSGSYQLYLANKRNKRMQNNVLSESDMDATDDIDDEESEELYCRTCDQWFQSLHNKREHLQGRQHMKLIMGDLKTRMDSDCDTDISTGPAEPRSETVPGGTTVTESIVSLISLVSKREREMKSLKLRVNEARAANNALTQQLSSLKERYRGLEGEMALLVDSEKGMESAVFELWRVPSLFILPELSDTSLDASEYFNSE